MTDQFTKCQPDVQIVNPLMLSKVYRARRKDTGCQVAIKFAVDNQGENNCKEPFLHASGTYYVHVVWEICDVSAQLGFGR